LESKYQRVRFRQSPGDELIVSQTKIEEIFENYEAVIQELKQENLALKEEKERLRIENDVLKNRLLGI
jgi:hypothetical protein